MIGFDLDQVAEVTGGVVHGDGAASVDSVVIDSREAGPGALFAALVGEHVDGHEYATAAMDAGASAILATRPTRRELCRRR